MDNTNLLLDDLADIKTDDLSIGAVLKAIFGQFGGPVGFAQEVKRDFDTCPVGHANRIRIEADVLRALTNYEGDTDNLPADPESLKALARELLGNRNHD